MTLSARSRPPAPPSAKTRVRAAGTPRSAQNRSSRDATVVLEGAHRGNDDRHRGLDPPVPALDVEELFRAEVGPESGLGHAILTEGESHARGEKRVTAVRDVCERAAV